MGTNFYRVPILTADRAEQLKNLIDDAVDRGGDYDELKEIIEKQSEKVHICKRSAGWYINFDHNWGEWYQPNRKSLEEFLADPNYLVEDEYGEAMTAQEFWKMVDEWNSKEGLWDSKGYEKWEWETNGKSYREYGVSERDKEKVRIQFGVMCDGNDFTVDGLRFSTLSDFC